MVPTSKSILNLFVLERLDESTVRCRGADHVATMERVRRRRIFGGQYPAQFYLAARLLVGPHHRIEKLRASFHSIGNVEDDILIRLKRLSGCLAECRAFQNDRLMASAVVRCTPIAVAPPLTARHRFPLGVPDPFELPTLAEIVLLRRFSDTEAHGWLTEYANRALFEVRPLDAGALAFLHTDCSGAPLRLWCRLDPRFHRDGENRRISAVAVVIILSDLFIFNPSRAVCYAVGQPDLFAMASSLSHEVIVHRHDDDNNNEKDDDGELDPFGFFLHELNCQVISANCMITDGRIFDERTRRCVVSFHQRGFFQSMAEFGANSKEAKI